MMCNLIDMDIYLDMGEHRVTQSFVSVMFGLQYIHESILSTIFFLQCFKG